MVWPPLTRTRLSRDVGARGRSRGVSSVAPAAWRTALLSNLGRIDGPVDSVAMFPACSGPRAAAIGLASTSGSTTLSLRTRRAEFDADEHARLLADLAGRFFA